MGTDPDIPTLAEAIQALTTRVTYLEARLAALTLADTTASVPGRPQQPAEEPPLAGRHLPWPPSG